MCKRIASFVAAALTCFAAACSPGQDGGADELFEPHNWTQLNGDPQASGFNPVHTVGFAGGLKWAAHVGPVLAAAPVSSPSGNVYVANSLGTLFGFSPNGDMVLAKSFVGEAILSTPAVDENGDIYLITSLVNSSNGQIACTLRRLSPDGDILHSAEVPLTTASPKVIRGRILVSTLVPPPLSNLARGEVIAFDAGLNVIARVGVGCANSTCFTAGSDFPCLTLDCIFLPDPPSEKQPRMPSVAVTDAGNLVGTGELLVVACASPCLAAYRLRAFTFEPLWSTSLDSDPCDDQFEQHTSPAIVLGGVVLVGHNHGRLFAFDAVSGERMWTTSVGLMTGTPTAGLRQIYASTTSGLYELDANGSILQHRPDSGVINTAPAQTLDHVFVAARNGLYAFTPDLSAMVRVSKQLSPHSDPAVDAAGNVYVVTKEGVLEAYSASPFVFHLAVPAVTWHTPIDGGTLSYAVGQQLTVNVDAAPGETFQGTVAFESDPDGGLCEANGTAPTITCVTDRPLTLGTHRLTAYARHPTGLVSAGAITVQVVSRPPAVTINSPRDGQKLFDQDTITFTAMVNDPEEPDFPAHHVRWTSDIAGDLDTGLTIQRALIAGSHTITATATDSKGITGKASLTIQVVTNTVPIVEITAPKDTDIFNNQDTITFTAKVTDPDEPSFPSGQVGWTSNLDGELGTGLAIQHKLTVGDHTITATATDSQGAAASDTVSLHIFPD